jgi:hypothetical protein
MEGLERFSLEYSRMETSQITTRFGGISQKPAPPLGYFPGDFGGTRRPAPDLYYMFVETTEILLVEDSSDSVEFFV